MILRTLASLLLLALLGATLWLPEQPVLARGPENRARQDIETKLVVGRDLPAIELMGLDGRVYTRDDLLGRPTVLTFERSLDWSPFAKARLLELRKAFASGAEPRIVWVMSDTQINARTRIFIGELGLAERILFLVDARSHLIRELGILKSDPEPIELGVPVPTTLVLDRRGGIRLVDVREDVHSWLDVAVLRAALAKIE